MNQNIITEKKLYLLIHRFISEDHKKGQQKVENKGISLESIDHLKLDALLYLMLLSLIWMRQHAHLHWILRTSVRYLNYRPDGQHIPAPLCHDSALAC